MKLIDELVQGMCLYPGIQGNCEHRMCSAMRPTILRRLCDGIQKQGVSAEQHLYMYIYTRTQLAYTLRYMYI